MASRRRSLLSALVFVTTTANAQTFNFELKSYPESPVALVNFTASTFRANSDRRQFFTVKNGSDKVTAAVVFQQSIGSGSSFEIVALERVSILIRPREAKRLSISVRDVWNQFQAAAKAGEGIGKPVLSVAVVEFTDGSSWSAPLGREEH